MAPPEPRGPTTARPEHPNAEEAEENNLKNNFILIEALKEEIKNFLKETEEKKQTKSWKKRGSMTFQVTDLRSNGLQARVDVAELPSCLLHRSSLHRGGMPQRRLHWKVTKEFTSGYGSSTEGSNPCSHAEITTPN